MARIVIERDIWGREHATVEGKGWLDDGQKEHQTLREMGYFQNHCTTKDEWIKKR